MRGPTPRLGRLLLYALLAAVVALAIVAPSIWSHAARHVDIPAASQGASGSHPFGTDALGRDMLARTLVATRMSIGLALAVVAIGFAAGSLLGMVTALVGRRAGRVLASTINVLVAFPALLLALLVATIVGVGSLGAVLALAAGATPVVARTVQTLAARVVTADYVLAARGAGVSLPRLMLRHILPNIAPPVVLQFAMGIGSAILALSALSFLGIGVQEPSYDWGSLLNSGLKSIYVTPIAALGPAAAIVIASLAFNLLGGTLADTLAVERPRASRRAPRRVGDGQPVRATGRAPATSRSPAALRVEELSVTFPTREGDVTPVREVSFAVRSGERLGIVGESGSGKSLTALAAAQLVEPPARARAAVVEVGGDDLATLARGRRARRLATSLAMVFQDPLSSLNPALRVGRQITEAAEVHLGVTRRDATTTAIERLRELRIAGPERRMQQYPHEMSGGMRQRATIAMGLMMRPDVIVADEPTTALDATVQHHVLRCLRQINEEHGAAVVLISHDVSVIAAFCARVLVMYGGRIVEELPSEQLRDASAHPYTRALLRAVPDMEVDRDRPLATIPGRPPAAHEIPPACPFAPRCEHATERCHTELPPLERLDERHRVACWHPQGPAAAAAAREEPAA